MRIWLPKFFYLVCWLASGFSLRAQMPGVRHYKISEGSDPTRIFTLFKDKQGYIFTGTSKGLYKFDGIKFNYIPFQNPVNNPSVTAIFQDAKNQLWIGMETGEIARLLNNKLKLFVPEEGTPRKTITAFLQDKQNNIWFSTDGEGIYYIANEHIYNISDADGLSENSVYSLALASNGEVLAGTDQGISICRLSGKKNIITNLSSKNGLPDNFVKTIVPAGNNTFWIGMQDKGLCLFDHTTGRFFIPSCFTSWNYGQINKLLTTEKSIWIATDNSGIIKAAGNIVNAVTFEKPVVNINDLIQDNEGNIWLLSNNNELMRTSGEQLKLLVNYREGEFQKVHAILYDRANNIWKGTEGGVMKYLSNGGEKAYPIEGIKKTSDITALFQDKFNRIWIGTSGNGIFLLDEKSGRYRRINENKLLVNSSVLSVTGSGDSVFVSSLEGAAAFDLSSGVSIDNKFNYYNFTNISSIGSNYVYDIFKDSKSRVWFATDGKGITVLENNNFINYGEKQGLKDEVIYSIAEDRKGDIWFSTHNAGVYRYDGKKFINYSTANGLSDINISAVKTDNKGNIVIIYKKGFDILNPETGLISYINSSQGIKEINVQDLGTVSQDNAGGVLVSTSDGILSYQSISGTVHRPQTILESATVFLTPIDMASVHKFTYDENSFSFSFIGLFYSDPEAVNYQYKLDGFNNEWISTKDRSVNFPKLPPGKYTFRVRSSINNNFSGSNEAAYEFTIQKPFWTAWWFIFSCLVIAGGIFYWYVKARERRVKKVERLQQEKIQFQFETLRNQVNPHFLFNSFNTLISIIEDDPEMAVEYVEQLSDFFRNIVNYRDKDVISLKEEIGLLQTYFFIQQKRFGENLKLKINLEEHQKSGTFIPPLTLQLLAENAIKHNAVSKEAPLTIELVLQDDRLLVTNNINKKFTKEAGAGMGLQNITTRYSLLTDKEVTIENDGSFFTVLLPVLKQKI